jgi:2-alkyl-3-oxoalkanoate reductase
VRVFVAGGSGAIGRRLIPMLIEAGHETTAMTRSEGNAEAIRATGALTAVVDVYDTEALAEAMREARPDAVVHQLTALPHRFDPRKKDIYDATNRLRTEGTRNLLAAAREAGAQRFVCQSIAFAYAPGGESAKDEEAPLALDAPEPFGIAVRAVKEMEDAVLGAGGIVLRYGWFYGPGTFYGEGGSSEADVRRRRFPVVGRGEGVFSFIHVDDAASATVVALERDGPAVFNVVDDDPAPMRDWLPAYAEAIGAKPPRRVPVWLAKLLAGGMVAAMAALPGATNARAKERLGWRPRWASWRQGFSGAPR